MVQQLGIFLVNPSNWFSVGVIVVSLAYVIAYDVIWTWIMKNEWSSYWFERAQAWLKIGIYLGLFGLIALFIFVPWPWNLIIVIAIVLALGFIMTWLSKQRH